MVSGEYPHAVCTVHAESNALSRSSADAHWCTNATQNNGFVVASPRKQSRADTGQAGDGENGSSEGCDKGPAVASADGWVLENWDVLIVADLAR